MRVCVTTNKYFNIIVETIIDNLHEVISRGICSTCGRYAEHTISCFSCLFCWCFNVLVATSLSENWCVIISTFRVESHPAPNAFEIIGFLISKMFQFHYFIIFGYSRNSQIYSKLLHFIKNCNYNLTVIFNNFNFPINFKVKTSNYFPIF
jgi:hypothetical protein